MHNIADKQTDLMIEEKHEAKERQRILKRVEEVTDLLRLIQQNPYDIIYEVYGIAFGDGHQAAEENVYDWIDRSEVCRGGD